MTIDQLLKPYQQFGINLGLSRIHYLLDALGNPQCHVPFIHVGGTNGKGSVCAYLSAVLSASGYRVGRYTSPHLIDWCERVSLNETTITPEELESALAKIIAIAPPQQEDSPTLFEIFTAAVWHYFAEKKVDIAVMEVGLGGRLDATNVREPCLLSIITSLSWEHWQVLGPTLTDIATEKAGIFKPGRPVFLGTVPDAAKTVFVQRAQALGCPLTLVPAAPLAPQTDPPQAAYQGWHYPLVLQGDYQRQNSALAIAALQELQRQGWSKITLSAVAEGMGNTIWPGRLQWVTLEGQKLLLDGAHNPAAAAVLAQYVSALQCPVNWIMGMLSTKEHDQIFAHLLRPGDRLWLVPVPGQNSANTKDLASLAQEICPRLVTINAVDNWASAWQTIQADPLPSSQTVLCGSLYLVGDFLAAHQNQEKSIPHETGSG